MEFTNTLNVLSQFIHPALMLVLFAYFLYAAYLGFQVRRTRYAEGELKKALLQNRYRLRHYQMGSLLLAVMVTGALGGIATTYFSAGQMFVDSHLLVGLTMTGLIAISAALSPHMQKGNDWARYTHIAINVSLLIFFSWQLITGLQGIQEILSPTQS